MKYHVAEVEKKWREFWEKEKIYKFDAKNKKKIYSVDTDPPTVSGNMHIGHALHYSQEDFFVRFHRMNGGGVFYPFGTDDNGLPTERLVERLKKVKSKNLPRNKFIELCLKTIKEIKQDFVKDWKDLGISCDYNVSYSTIDDNSRKISQKFFLDLVKKDLVYRKEFPTIWCPECQTSIAQAELEDKEQESLFSTLKFSCQGKDLLIATTRPELLGACVAVFVNPEDKRYKSLIGKKAKVPIFEQEVPIISDASAEIGKGTGVLMVCSYGDKYDVDAINRYKLNPKIVINEKGELNVGEYKGLRIQDARRKILEDLEKASLIEEQKKIRHVVNVHDKCGTGIEFLPTEQWFIKVLDEKKTWIDQGRKINWYPKSMRKRYENWVEGLDWDWSISRDRYFGVPIPVWKCEKCNKVILASEKELPVDPLQTKKKCPECKKDAVPEKMVLDTWATSSLTPQIASSLVKDKVKVPYSLRPQAHDIIRTWAFYTIVRSYFYEKKLPWKDIAVSGFVTLKGEKMSKSKGNVVDPKKVLEQYGADALRYWASSSKLGEDLDYQEQDLVAGKKLVTKLLNASRFIFMNLGDFDGKRPRRLETLDKIFLDELNVVVKNVTGAFLNYDYSKARFEIENFFWKMFCDNYLEIVKKRVYQGKGEKKKSAQYVLYTGLLAILKMLSPIVPFVTEEIYQEYFKNFEKNKSIHISEWPKFEKGKKELEEVYFFSNFVELISKVRQEKSKAKKAMNAECVVTIPKADKEKLEDFEQDLKDVMNIKEIKTGDFGVGFY